MKTKKTFYGLINMNATLYNILYTLLCVCVLLCVLALMVYGLTGLKRECVIESVQIKHLVLVYAIMTFLIYRLFSKKHYA